MIQVSDNNKCCGCNACIEACPKQCISSIIDNEGFKYPVVDSSKCVDCHLCEKVCPMLNPGTSVKPLSVEAMIYEDESKRLESSSGGVFTPIAEEIIRRRGVVFGASYTKDWHVLHTYTEKIEGLKKYRGSKYVQCDTADSYKVVRQFLKNDRWVLYSGTPCQIRGLLLFLGKDYDKLVTVDFICHGVPSHEVLMSYVKNEIAIIAKKRGINESQITIDDIRFRDKTYGWKSFSFALTLGEENESGKTNSYQVLLRDSAYMKGYGANLYLRPSCHECPAKNFTSGSDITLADYWRVQFQHPEFDDDKGTSLIAINSEKGSELLESVRSSMKRQKVDFEQAYKIQTALFRSMPKPANRAVFWANDWKNNFCAEVEKIVNKKTIRQKIEQKVRSFFRTIGLKNIVEKFRKY